VESSLSCDATLIRDGDTDASRLAILTRSRDIIPRDPRSSRERTDEMRKICTQMAERECVLVSLPSRIASLRRTLDRMSNDLIRVSGDIDFPLNRLINDD
jgi:hypothetical protein